MKKLFLALALLSAACVTSKANQGNVSYYGTASGSYAFLGSDFDAGPGVNVALGALINSVHAVEIELSYFDSALKNFGGSDFKVMPILASYKYNTKVSDKVSLYVGGTIGLTYTDMSYWWWSGRDSLFTYGAKAGISYAVTPAISFDFAGTALHLNEGDNTSAGNIQFISAGVSFKF